VISRFTHPTPERILAFEDDAKANFLENAVAEAEWYGARDLVDWLDEEYGLTYEQSVDLAMQVMTTQGCG